MEVFLASRFHHTASLDFSSDDHMNMNGDDEARAYFPCPFCYIEIELPVLCSHLQEEHCFGLNNAVCPLCAANLGKDALSHFTMQHSHSVKRKRKSQRSGLLSNLPIALGKDFRDISSFFGSSSIGERDIVEAPVPDSLLSPFLCNSQLLDLKADQEEKGSSTTVSRRADTDDFSEQYYEERGRKAAFAQELILSVIF